jgi:hypothetical protein
MLGRAKPEIAELSFKYALSEGAEAGAAARRALALFKALQSDLKEWASPDRETKTSAALPAACHREVGLRHRRNYEGTRPEVIPF